MSRSRAPNAGRDASSAVGKAVTGPEAMTGATDQEAATTSRSRSDRLIASITLMNLSAPAAIAVIVVLIGVSWFAAYFLGGGTSNVAPHWFYIPVFLAGLRFGPFGALVVAAISMIVAGPLLPADVSTNTPQALSDWVSRGIFFILIGQFVTLLFGGVRRLSANETRLEAKVELSTAERQAREARFSALVQHASDLVTIVEADATILFQSPSITRILGWDEETSLGTNLLDAIHDSDQERWRTIVDLLTEDSGEMVIEWRARHADGSWRYLQTVVTNLIHEPSVGGLVLNSRDITDQKALEEQLRHQAFHDTLTGLANRALFSEQLDQAVRRRGRIGGGLALLFIDLDKFKTVNDLHGHALGDELLKQTAERLRTTLRDADAIARLGGDEFAVLFEGVALDSYPGSAAERIIESFTQPFRLQSSEVLVTASIGMALDESGTESAEDLLRNADLAMYAAKTKNEGSYEVFTSGMHSKILDRMQVEADLRRALSHDEFQVYYQPIIDNSSGAIGGVEALIRWIHPERGLVEPDDFIYVAESSGIIVQIGEWMLEHACQEFAALTRGVVSGEALGLSVNLSARQLRDPTLFDTVCSAAAGAGLDTTRLTLEITESSIMEDIEVTIRVLTQLRSIGVKIAIDDFGTGYSSLSLLSQIPVDTLKIDRAFVTDIAKRPEPARLVRAILLLASDFGLHTVAEGVEELDQQQLLEDLGCQANQGFYFARPQPAAQLFELLKQDGSISTGVRSSRA
jgi:diguanylate cyclase (GGDEF)-like protein/PAS domain S-box-containing protein